MTRAVRWELRKQKFSRTYRSFFFYAITFIPCSSSLFIIHVRTAALYEKELDGIRNWPSVLGTLLPSSWKAMSSQAQNSMANLRACRLSIASFRTVFFPFVFLTSARAYVTYAPQEPCNSIFLPSIKFSYRRFRRRLWYFSPHSSNTFNINCLLLTHRLYNIYLYLKLGAYLIKIR